MTQEEINKLFPPQYAGNAQISDLRLALSKVNTELRVSKLKDLNDVNIQNTTDGQFLVWDANEQKWINNSVNIGGADVGKLKEVTENGKTGWRIEALRSYTPLEIGTGAIDLVTTPSYYTSAPSGASGDYSHAEGYGTIASGKASHAEGYGYYSSAASGVASHVEGYGTNASGRTSHAEGLGSNASGNDSHAEGLSSKASGNGSHAEGEYTKASGNGSHAEGKSSTAEGDYSHAEGDHTIAQNDVMHAAGKYNTGTAPDTIHETGIGTSKLDRKNAFEIYTDGTITAPEATPNLVQSRGDQALVPVSYLFSSEFGNSLPTTDPHVAGKLWNDSGILKVSAG